MAVAFGSSSGTTSTYVTSNASTLSVSSVTVITGTENYLAVTPAWNGSTARTVSSLTYAGAGITQLASASAANNAGVVKQGTDIWRKVTPASGANTLAVTMSGNCASIALPWASFSGVDTTTPEGTASTATTGAVTPAGFTAGDATIAICSAENAGNTMTAGQTQSSNLNIHLIEDFQCVQEYSTSTSSMTWTNASANPAASGVVIKQAAGAAATTIGLLLPGNLQGGVFGSLSGNLQ
jgi:hypothetical protein